MTKWIRLLLALTLVLPAFGQGVITPSHQFVETITTYNLEVQSDGTTHWTSDPPNFTTTAQGVTNVSSTPDYNNNTPDIKEFVNFVVPNIQEPITFTDQNHPGSSFTVYSAAAQEFTILPGNVPVNATNVIVHLIGKGTVWQTGYLAVPQFRYIGSCGGKVDSSSVEDNTHATVVIDTGTCTGQMAIQDPTFDYKSVSGGADTQKFWVKNPMWLAPVNTPGSGEQHFVVTGTTTQVMAYNTAANWTSSTTFATNCGEITGTKINSAVSATLTIRATTGECAGAIQESTNGYTAALQHHTPQTFWIRPDGGTRYATSRVNNNMSAQCNGLYNKPYSGDGGSNENCAFNDYRFLWDDQVNYATFNPAIHGGDTAILASNAQWRVGGNPTANGQDSTGAQWCLGSGSLYCTNPNIPSGIPTQPTRILGSNYAACSTGTVNGVGGTVDKSKLSQLFGGVNLESQVLNLKGTQWTNIECLEITRHSGCAHNQFYNGSDGSPDTTTPVCFFGSSTQPAEDTASVGIGTDPDTQDVTVQDTWIHNLTSRGIQGTYGLGTFTLNRTDIGYNTTTNVDFDLGDGPSGNSPDYNTPDNVIPQQDPFGNYSSLTWKMVYSVNEFAGCIPEYPYNPSTKVHARRCYGQSNGGQGDGIGSSNADQEFDVLMDHDTFRYNVQDGEDFGHMGGDNPHIFTTTNSAAYGSAGSQWKWGTGFTTVTFDNNVAVGNCFRFQQPLLDSYPNWGINMTDNCRAGDTLSFNIQDNTTVQFSNNSIVSYDSGVASIQCVPSAGQTANCSNSHFAFSNNLYRGYSNKLSYAGDLYNGNGIPALFCAGSCNDNGNNNAIGQLYFYKNAYYGFRDCNPNPTSLYWATAVTSSGETCGDPGWFSEPTANPITGESEMDSYSFALNPKSASVHAGVPVSKLTVDFDGNPYANPPSMGALELGSQYFTPVYTGGSVGGSIMDLIHSLIMH